MQRIVKVTIRILFKEIIIVVKISEMTSAIQYYSTIVFISTMTSAIYNLLFTPI